MNHAAHHALLSAHSPRRYARSITIVYESERSNNIKSNERLRLMTEVRKTYDFGLGALYDLFLLFLHAVRPGQGLVGPKTFRAVLARHGVKDTVLQQRLFGEFADPKVTERLDFRNFVREFAVIEEDARLEDKIDLLFDVYDLDQSDSISMSELMHIVVAEYGLKHGPPKKGGWVRRPALPPPYFHLPVPHTWRSVWPPRLSPSPSPAACLPARVQACRLTANLVRGIPADASRDAMMALPSRMVPEQPPRPPLRTLAGSRWLVQAHRGVGGGHLERDPQLPQSGASQAGRRLLDGPLPLGGSPESGCAPRGARLAHRP